MDRLLAMRTAHSDKETIAVTDDLHLVGGARVQAR